jgi:hypothetical protein
MPAVGCGNNNGGGGNGGSGGTTEQVFPCSEQGIRDAIVEGGGPHTFACDGPQTVVTEGEIVIDNDVILDGEGNLTIDGNDNHRVLSVPEGVTTELRGLTVTGGGLTGSFEAPELGAGIYNAGTLTLSSSTVAGNRLRDSGQGTVIGNVGSLSMTGVTFSDNTCSCNGTIQNEGTMTATNSTVSGNVPGGFYNIGTLTLTNTTMAANDGHAIAIDKGGLLEIRSSIVDGLCATYGLAGIASFGGNIESPGDTCRFHRQAGDRVNVTEEQLNLGSLQDNGGPTMTHALLPGSIAIDTTGCGCSGEMCEPLVVTDQRGVTRPQGLNCDVGAFELEIESDTCLPSGWECSSPELVEPIVKMCEINVPDQLSACDGTESIENPTSCTGSGSTVTYKLTQMQLVRDCNTGYDLDGCDGLSCVSPLTFGEGTYGIDNGLLVFDGICFEKGCTPIDIGSLDQAFHDAICAGGIDIEIEVAAASDEGCAVVTMTAGGEPGEAIPMNLSDDGCLSGNVGAIPIQLAEGQSTIENAVVRMTVSSKGFSDGILGGTTSGSNAEAILESIASGLSAVGFQFYDINADLSGNWHELCDGHSLTLQIGGYALP